MTSKEFSQINDVKELKRIANDLIKQENYWLALEYYLKVTRVSPEDISNWIDLGIAYIKSDDFDEVKAIKSFEKAIELDPKSAKPVYFLGKIQENQDIKEKAIEYFEKALELDYRYEPALFALVNIYKEMKNKEKYKESAKIFVEKHPKSEVALYLLGDAYIDNEEFAKAVEVLEKARSLKPDDALILQNLALAYSLTRDGLNAIKYSELSLEINPYLEATWTILFGGCALTEDKERFQEAKKKATELLSQRSDLLLKDGIKYQNEGKIAFAIRHYQKAIELNPKEIEAYYHLGNIYWKNEKYIEATAIWQKAFETYPCERTIRVLTHALELRYIYQAAIDFRLIYAEMFPNDMKNLFFIAHNYHKIGKLEKALEFFNKVLEIAPEAPDHLTRAGELYLELGEIKKGYTLIKKAFDIDPENTFVNYHLGRAHNFSGNHRESITLLDKILQNNRSELEKLNLEYKTYLLLSESFHRLDNLEKAKENLEMALKVNSSDRQIKKKLKQIKKELKKKS